MKTAMTLILVSYHIGIIKHLYCVGSSHEAGSWYSNELLAVHYRGSCCCAVASICQMSLLSPYSGQSSDVITKLLIILFGCITCLIGAGMLEVFSES